MSTVSVSLPSDGSTADVSDYNTPINTIVNEINGNMDNANIKTAAAIDGAKLADASITNAKLATGAGEPAGAWNSWTPTWTNLSVGNGTLTAKYKQVGKTVFFSLHLLFGTTTSVTGLIAFTLPVTSTTPDSALMPIAFGSISNAGGGAFNSFATHATTTTAQVRYWNTNNNQADSSATAPDTFATNYRLMLKGTYEAA